jgi:hypothetical protein
VVLGKIKGNPNQDTAGPDRNSNRVPAEYKPEAVKFDLNFLAKPASNGMKWECGIMETCLN